MGAENIVNRCRSINHKIGYYIKTHAKGIFSGTSVELTNGSLQVSDEAIQDDDAGSLSDESIEVIAATFREKSKR